MAGLSHIVKYLVIQDTTNIRFGNTVVEINNCHYICIISNNLLSVK